MKSFPDTIDIEVQNTSQQWIYNFMLFERDSNQQPVLPDNLVVTGPTKDRLYFYSYREFMDHICIIPEKFESIMVQVITGARIFNDQCIEYRQKDSKPQIAHTLPGRAPHFIFDISGILSVDSRLIFDIASWTTFRISFCRNKPL